MPTQHTSGYMAQKREIVWQMLVESGTSASAAGSAASCNIDVDCTWPWEITCAVGSEAVCVASPSVASVGCIILSVQPEGNCSPGL